MSIEHSGHIPYETLARAEAEDITDAYRGMFEGLGNDCWKLIEVIAHAYNRGLEDGFDMAEFQGEPPGTIIDAYNAGYRQAEIDNIDKGE